MMPLLQDQVAIITGGSVGIGKAIATKFAQEGASVLLFGTNKERGDFAVKELLEQFPQCKAEFYQVDVASFSAVDEALKKIIEKFGKVDILVNNAGITRDQLLLKMTEEDWDQVLDTNLKSCFNTTKALVRAMLKAKKGKIINITSVVGLVGNAGQANYAASKAGMIGFSKALATEFASRNIQVNCIAPGWITTAMTDSLTSDQKQSILNEVPMGRMGEASEIGDAALFLASKMSSYITGQVLTVDGGLTMV